MLEVFTHMPTALRSEHNKQLNDDHAELLRRVAENSDKTAFTDLFAHFGPRLKGFMMRKGANAELAEDLAQDTMIKVWRKAKLYSDARGSVSTWIFTIARNIRIDTFRRTSGLRFDEISDFDFESDELSGEDNVNARQETEIVAAAVSTLPQEQREVIEMAFSSDLTHMEIAEKLDQPLGTIKSRMRLAYQKLSAALEELR